MAVPEQIPYQEFISNGSTNRFDLNFLCKKKEHLIVKLDDAEANVGDWTFTDNAVVFSIAPDSGVKVSIQRRTPNKRSANYQSYNSSFSPNAVNEDFDALWMRLQEEEVAKAFLNQLIEMNYEDLDEKSQAIRLDLINQLTEKTTQLNQTINNKTSQLQNQIIQQGVSQQQIDTYAKKMMDDIASISIDKGWTDKLVAMTSGGTLDVFANNINQSFVFTAQYKLISSSTIDQSSLLQAAANEAKEKNATLIINAISNDMKIVAHNIDIVGLKVLVQDGVTFLPPDSASTGYTFVAIGTELQRITKKTVLENAILDAKNKTQGVFKSEYANEPQAINCKALNVPTGVNPDGSGVNFKECINPLVERGYYHGGRQGVLFMSCTRPIARNVETEHQGRDGILFYTNPTGTTTTDALADNCIAKDYCVNGEAGRAGIHFYGVRRATAIAPQGSNDNGCTHDDTGAVRFRDCEDYYVSGYIAKDAITGVIVNEIGDYATEPHNIVVRGNIGQGTIENVREYGVAVATPNRSCNVIGVIIKGVATTKTVAAAIYHVGTGVVSDCDVQEASLVGISVAGNVSVTNNKFKNTGRGGNSTPQLRLAGNASASGNTFTDDRTTNAGTLAIRVISGTATVGENTYGAGITDFVQLDTGATLSRDSAVIRTKFAGIPTFLGTTQNGCRAIDPDGAQYTRVSGAWRRNDLKKINATIETTQTTVAHGLGYKPTIVNLTVKGNSTVWQSAVADTNNVYLTASVSVNVDINVQ